VLIDLSGSTKADLLALYAMAFMVGAAVVLVGSDPKMIRGALVQGSVPAIALVMLLIT
jgi:hypothetical protein